MPDMTEAVELLLDRLERYTLDPRFEAYGDFITRSDPALKPGEVSFFGNFHDYSGVFNIRTTDAIWIAEIEAAILANKARPAYAAARAEHLGAEGRRRAHWAEKQAREAAARRENLRKHLDTMGG